MHIRQHFTTYKFTKISGFLISYSSGHEYFFITLSFMKKIIILLVAAFAMMSCGNTPQKAPTADDMRAKACQELSYLGRVSGRDEDKVAGAGLTVEFTELGNPIYAEADLAIECKKIYAQQFNAELLPLEQREWYEKSGLGIHYMFIGEIVHVWKK